MAQNLVCRLYRRKSKSSMIFFYAHKCRVGRSEYSSAMHNNSVGGSEYACPGSDYSSQAHIDTSDIRRSNVSRALRTVENIFDSNDWDFFVTITVSQKTVSDRSDYAEVRKRLTYALNHVFLDGSVRYILVPDYHEDGSLHFHGFFSFPLGNKAYFLRRAGSFRLFKQGAHAPKYYCPRLNRLLGRNDFRPLYAVFGESSLNYVLKYVQKAAYDIRVPVGSTLYVRSKGLLTFLSCVEYRGDDAEILYEALPVVGIKKRVYDYGCVVCPYLDEMQENELYRIFYYTLALRYSPSKLFRKSRVFQVDLFTQPFENLLTFTS